MYVARTASLVERGVSILDHVQAFHTEKTFFGSLKLSGGSFFFCIDSIPIKWIFLVLVGSDDW